LSVGILIFVFAPSQIFAIVVMFVWGIGIGGTNPVLSSLWPEIYGTQHLGAIRSVATVVMVFGSALGPVFMGLALDASISLEMIGLACVLITISAAILAGMALRIR
jgi:predicted MFS family arabinose efflux permease